MKSFFVSCPNCHHNFEPIEAQSQFITNEIETALAKEKAQLNKKQKELLEKEARLKNSENEIAEKVQDALNIRLLDVEAKVKREQAKIFNTQVQDLKNQLIEKEDAIQKVNQMQLQTAQQLREADARQQNLDREVEQRVDSILKSKATEIQAKARENERIKYELTLQDIKDELKEKEAAIRSSKETQLALTKQLREATERQQKIDLEIEQKVLEKLESIKLEVQASTEGLYKHQIAQKDKKIHDIEQQLETARRTAAQGSQQSQGEVLELEFEKELAAKYPLDQFMPVKKGCDGADLIQNIINSTGKKTGSILWEFKNTKAFKNEWLIKLKSDQRQAEADVSILVTKTLPKDVQSIEMIDGVLVVSFALAIPISSVVRKSIDDLSYAHLKLQGQDEKMRLVYNYLTGTQFKIKIKAILSAFKTLKDEIEIEKRAFKKMWASRERMLEQIIDSTSSMYGDIEGIAGSVTPKIDELEIPAFTLLEEKQDLQLVEKMDS